MTGPTEDVLRLVCGVTTAAEVAAKHGVTEAEVERWRLQHVRAIERLARPPSARRLRASAVAALAVLAAGVGLVSTDALAQVACAQTLPMPLKTFCAGDPALVADVNGNTQKLVDFIQQKVGTVGNANISTAGTLNTGAATVASLTSSGTSALVGNVTVGGNMNFGARTGQHLNLYNAQYGIGIQDSTLYSRGDTFAWHRMGTHTNAPADPGTGGTRLAYLDASGNLEIRGELRANNFRHRNCQWGAAGPGIGADGQVHAVYCPSGTFAAGWQCTASTYLDGNCAMLCCSP